MNTIPVSLHKDIIDFIEAVADHAPWYWELAEDSGQYDDVAVCAACDAHMPYDLLDSEDADELSDSEEWIGIPENHAPTCIFRKACELKAELVKLGVIE